MVLLPLRLSNIDQEWVDELDPERGKICNGGLVRGPRGRER